MLRDLMEVPLEVVSLLILYLLAWPGGLPALVA
jgi:hypothetical protein